MTIDELSVFHFDKDAINTDGTGTTALEYLRYKRCADALLKAELQILNRVPLTLADMAYIWKERLKLPDLDILVRSIYTVLVHEGATDYSDESMIYLSDTPFQVPPDTFLLKLNTFRGVEPMLINIQAVLRQQIMQCDFKHLAIERPCVRFLVEWIQSALKINEPSTSAQVITEKTDNKNSTSEKRGIQQKPAVNANLEEASVNSTSSTAMNAYHIKEEIDRSVNEQLGRALEKQKEGNSRLFLGETVENLRYEMIKMQQELLKRKVLNPLFYNALSVDTAPFDKKMTKVVKRPPRLSTLISQRVFVGKVSSISLHRLFIISDTDFVE